uniref:Phospholipase/carboxylesterase/thioesterase domain-containing protein n=1 Tax=Dunaliella tertiolecta TaxID=3047 RepID=A0A7S3R8Y2_DUNTE|mmetsp:Transcript_6726/g.18005  ORF Transcript_6726/g.18005 Transcript_6726/m.18005 type:complete len:263 (+) Transcript_6726:33-821(+)
MNVLRIPPQQSTLISRSLVAKGTKTSPCHAMAQLSYPSPTVLEKGNPDAAVIYLHGLGDSANGWVDENSGKSWAGTGPRLLSQLPNVRFVFPTAPQRPCTLKGQVLTGWYDIHSVEGINTREDAAGLRESQRYIEELVQAQVASGIPSDRVLVGGFSQGGAISLLMLRSKMKLAGVLGMSTYLPLWEEDTIISPENRSTPILICHGDDDQGVLYKYGQQTAEQLQKLGANVGFKVYAEMGHSTCDQEMEDMKNFITKCLPPK